MMDNIHERIEHEEIEDLLERQSVNTQFQMIALLIVADFSSVEPLSPAFLPRGSEILMSRDARQRAEW